jgi:hypothetical protein
MTSSKSFGQIHFSSTNRSGAFIRWAWGCRDGMPNDAREGMVQSVYTALIGHVEGLLAEVLLAEYRRIMLAANHNLAQRGTSGLQLAGSTVLEVIRLRVDALSTLTFDGLMKEASVIFAGRFDAAAEMKPDLVAVRRLRNQFAHGRPVTLPLARETEKRIDTDRTALKEAIDRLMTAGVLAREDVKTTNDWMASDEARLFEKLHSDAAVMYFYGTVKAFEDAVYSMPGLDLDPVTSTRLPNLQSL